MSTIREWLATLQIIQTVIAGIAAVLSTVEAGVAIITGIVRGHLGAVRGAITQALTAQTGSLGATLAGLHRDTRLAIGQQSAFLAGLIRFNRGVIRDAANSAALWTVGQVSTEIRGAESRLDATLRAILNAVGGGTVSVDVDADDVAAAIARTMRGWDLATNAEVRDARDKTIAALTLTGQSITSFVAGEHIETRGTVETGIERVMSWLANWQGVVAPKLTDILGRLNAVEANILGAVVREATRVVSEVGDKVGTEAETTREAIGDARDAVLEAVGTSGGASAEKVTDEADRVIRAVTSEADRTRTQIRVRHETTRGTVLQEAQGTRRRIDSAADLIIESAAAGVLGIERVLGALQSQQTESANSVVRRIIDAILGEHANLSDAIFGAFRIDLTAIVDWIARLLGAERSATRGVVDAVRDVIRTVTSGEGSDVEALDKQTVQLGRSADSLEDIYEWLDNLESPEERRERRRGVDRMLDGLLSGWIDSERPGSAALGAANRLLGGIGTGSEGCSTTNIIEALYGPNAIVSRSSVTEAQQAITTAAEGIADPILRPIAKGIAWLVEEAGGAIFGHLALAQQRGDYVRLAYLWQTQCMPIGESAVLSLHRMGYLSERDALAGLRQWGYNESRARLLIAGSYNAPPPGSVLDAWHRNIVTEQYADDALRRAGLDEQDRTMLKRQSYYRAPPSDLILMSVRDVFSPAARRRLSLDEDFPTEFAKRAAEIGITESLAKDYWAAHWSLPALGQGYSMLHRGVIDDATLDDLMRAKDIAPIWRPRLKAISYRPLNRIDVRRMYGVDVLDRAAVVKSYLDLGYSPANAERMAEYTVRYEDAREPTVDEQEAQGLTRATILDMLSRGILSEADAKTLLADSGMTDEVANLYVSWELLQMQTRRQDERIDTYFTLYREGQFTDLQLASHLAAMPLTDHERTLLHERLEQARARRERVPSRTDLDRASKQGLVKQDEYLATLTKQGWSSTWANRFWQMANPPPEPEPEPEQEQAANGR